MPGFVQTANTGSPSGSSFTSRSCTFSGAQTAGNLNAVIITFGHVAGATVSNIISSVADTKGNVYVPSNTFQFFTAISNDTLAQIIYHCPNIIAAAAGTNAVTVTLTASTPYFCFTIIEESGVGAVDSFIGAVASGSTGTAANSGSLTTTAANDVLLGAMACFDGPAGTQGALGSFTQRALVYTELVADLVAVSTGSYSFTGTAGGPQGWVSQLIAFKTAVAALHFPIAILGTSVVVLGWRVTRRFGFSITDSTVVSIGFQYNVPGIVHFPMAIVDSTSVHLGWSHLVQRFALTVVSQSVVLALGFENNHAQPPPVVILMPPYTGQNQPQLIEVTADIAWRESQREEGCWVLPPYASIYPEVPREQGGQVPPPISKTDLWAAMQTWPL